MAFFMGGVQLPLGHFEEAVYFITLISNKFLVILLSTLQEWKTELTLEPLNSFEQRTPVLGIQHLKH